MVEPGTMFLDKYRIERILGQGGMGIVAHAHHEELDRPVAIKFLLPEMLGSQDLVDRFRREAQAAVKLRSEHVCHVYDVGTLDSGAPYMVMEFLAGRDLSALLREQGRLAPGFAVDLLLQACEALAEAHALGIVHRDIKPANCFVTKGIDGVPMLKVLDFGISKSLVTDHNMTHSQAILGTPAYMSPEQLESSKNVDARADIWSLGVMLYQMVSGRKPFQAPGFPGLCLMVTTQPPPPLNDVDLPNGFEAVIAHCLAKNPDARIANAAMLAQALAPYAATPMHAQRLVARAWRLVEKDTGVSAPEMTPVTGSLNSHWQGVATASVPITTMAESRGQQVDGRRTEVLYPTPEPASRPIPVTAPSQTPSGADDRPRGVNGGVTRGVIGKALIGLGAAAAVVVALSLAFGLPWAEQEAPAVRPAVRPVVRPVADTNTAANSSANGAKVAAQPAAADDGAEQSLDAGVAQQAVPAPQELHTTDESDGTPSTDERGDAAGVAQTEEAARAERREKKRAQRSARKRGDNSSKRGDKDKPAPAKRPSAEDDLFGTRN